MPFLDSHRTQLPVSVKMLDLGEWGGCELLLHVLLWPLISSAHVRVLSFQGDDTARDLFTLQAHVQVENNWLDQSHNSGFAASLACSLDPHVLQWKSCWLSAMIAALQKLHGEIM